MGDGAMTPPTARILPGHWRAVDFISDLHLAASMPATFQAWADHLQHTDADAVIIVGDLFEVWVGDDARHRGFEAACLDVLSSASSHRWLGFLHGNRDFLLGPAMAADCGLTLLPDPTLLQAWGRRVLVTHGDEWCLSDVDYQAFRRTVRSPGWQREFLARPLGERLQLAAQMRRESRARQAFDGRPGADVDVPTAVSWLDACGADTLVHGHTHRPDCHRLQLDGRDCVRHVLADWHGTARWLAFDGVRLTTEGSPTAA